MFRKLLHCIALLAMSSQLVLTGVPCACTCEDIEHTHLGEEAVTHQHCLTHDDHADHSHHGHHPLHKCPCELDDSPYVSVAKVALPTLDATFVWLAVEELGQTAGNLTVQHETLLSSNLTESKSALRMCAQLQSWQL